MSRGRAANSATLSVLQARWMFGRPAILEVRLTLFVSLALPPSA